MCVSVICPKKEGKRCISQCPVSYAIRKREIEWFNSEDCRNKTLGLVSLFFLRNPN